MEIQDVSKAFADGNWRLAALLAIILITKLITQFKKYWAPLASGKVAWTVAVLTGVAAAALPRVNDHLSYATWLSLGVDGALTGLASAGLYRGAQTFSTPKNTKDDLLPFPKEPPVLPDTEATTELKKVALGKVELKKHGLSSEADTPVEKPKK